MDHKLKTACPWIDTPVGEKIKLNREDDACWMRAVADYLKAVVNRIQTCEDANLQPPFNKSLKRDALKGDP